MTLPPLYSILDDQAAALAGWDPVDLARVWFDAGVRLLQIRAKLASGAHFLDLCARVGELAHAAGALLVVNDRFAVALAAGVLAVHVGQDDLPVSAVRRWLGPEGIIGLSTHTREQIDAALYEPISYLAVGPVFGTESKDTGYDAVGPALVAYAASKTTLPIVAIGGITEARARSVIEAGAASVAVIGDLLHGDPGARGRAIQQALR